MRDEEKFKKVLKRRAAWLLALLMAMAALSKLADYPHLIEQYYSQNLFIQEIYVLHMFFNWVPFSAGDVIYVFVILMLLLAVVRLIRRIIRKEFTRFLLTSLSVAISIGMLVFVFYLFWGMNYFRPAAATRLAIQTQFTDEELISATASLIDSANQLRSSLSKTDLDVGDEKIFRVASEAVHSFSSSMGNVSQPVFFVKHSLLTPLLNYMGTAGYYNPFTAEGQVNAGMPVLLRPFTACHEMAHQIGIGTEDEANFVGFIAGIHSPDRLLKYSAYFMGLGEFMATVKQRDSSSYEELRTRISQQVLGDYQLERNYWDEFQGPAGTLSAAFYDYFLKANNQPEGLARYSEMVRLTIGYFRKSDAHAKLLQPAPVLKMPGGTDERRLDFNR